MPQRMIVLFNRMITVLITIILCLVGAFMYTYFSMEPAEETTWEYHGSPEEAGFNPEALDQARTYYESLNSTAAMVVSEGKVLFSWGDVTKNTNAHSVRKSFLSAL
jgi:hypothetical protein